MTLVYSLFWATRPLQWIKGLFIFLPLIFGGKLFDASTLIDTCILFFAFNFVSSAIYLINDIVDIKDDRAHPKKSKRPLAAGQISVTQALLLAILIGTIGLVISVMLVSKATLILVVYIVVNFLYIFFLKHIEIIDVFCIALFYYFRLLSGGVVGEIELSNWIVMCTCLLALFLGFNKRKGELAITSGQRPVLKKYNESFLDRMISIIATSMVVMYSVYVVDGETIARIGNNYLVCTVPLVYYGIFRYIYLIDNQSLELAGDPIRILYKDLKIQLTVLIWIAFCVWTIYFNG